jgi:hypothetical protein
VVTLTSSDLRLVRLAAAHGALDHRVVQSGRTLLLLMLPRAAFQLAFLALVGGFSGPGGERFAFVGATVQSLSLAAVIYAGLTVADEREDGVGAQLRLSLRSPVPIRLARCWVYVAQGLVFILVGAGIVGLLLGVGDTALRLLPLAPLYVLAAASMLGFGIAMASLAPSGYELIVLNLANSALVVLGGSVFPLAALHAAAGPARLLPGVNALLAIRAALAGSLTPWPVLAELGVLALWLGAAFASDSVVSARARRGHNTRSAGW